jgi:hypothetical protein
MAHVPQYDQGGGYGDQQDYPPQQQQQYPPQQQYQPQGQAQYGGGGQGFNEDQMMSGLNDMASNPMLGASVGMGRAMLQGQLDKMMPSGVTGFMAGLKYYFTVDNSYVARKLQTLIFPFKNSSGWKRAPGTGNGGKWLPPVHDINAPDLYIPCMSLVTFALVTAFVKGTAGKFTPEVLTDVMSYNMLVNFIEVMMLKAALVMLQSSTCSILDLIAYSGYKYFGLVINMVAGLCLGKSMYYVVMLYTGCSMAFFMIKILSAATVEHGTDPTKRKIVIVCAGFLQLLLIWWLGYSSDLSAAAPAVHAAVKANLAGDVAAAVPAS